MRNYLPNDIDLVQPTKYPISKDQIAKKPPPKPEPLPPFEPLPIYSTIQTSMGSQIFLHPISTTRIVEYHCARTACVSRNTLIHSTPLIEALYIIYARNTIYSWFHADPLVTLQNNLPPARAAYCWCLRRTFHRAYLSVQGIIEPRGNKDLIKKAMKAIRYSSSWSTSMSWLKYVRCGNDETDQALEFSEELGILSSDSEPKFNRHSPWGFH